MGPEYNALIFALAMGLGFAAGRTQALKAAAKAEVTRTTEALQRYAKAARFISENTIDPSAREAATALADLLEPEATD